jgi:arylsulfatase A-like enzyme
MKDSHPHAVIVNCAETDILGHANKWEQYLSAIREVDSLIWVLWKYIQSDSIYKNTTTLFVTNDHGRHDNEHGGFKSHGDSCEGCRHIMLLALGPQFKRGAEIMEAACQIDIAPTAAELLDITFPTVPGRSLLRDQSGRMKH